MVGTTYCLTVETDGTEREYQWRSAFSLLTPGLDPKKNLFLLAARRNGEKREGIVSLPRPVFELVDFEKIHYTQHYTLELLIKEGQAISSPTLSRIFAHSNSETWRLTNGSEDTLLKILSAFTSANYTLLNGSSGVSRIQVSGKGIVSNVVDKLAPLLSPTA